MPIRECRAADVAAMSDRSSLGVTVLATRKWLRLRGFNKECVDIWMPDAGPSIDLLTAYRGGLVSWPEFSLFYKDEQRHATTCRVVRYDGKDIASDDVLDYGPLAVLGELEDAHGDVSVLCWEESLCHRFLLVDLAMETTCSNSH
jgi:uncharacterized protein YeaO (DUF488 family)